MSDNNITLIGNVTRDPEVRATTGGQTKVTIGLAVNRRWQNRQTNEWEEQVSFFNVILWRDLADNAAATIAKGNRIIVQGRLEQRSWDTDDGKRSVVEVIADDIGPSLRWATAEITRTSRTGNGNAPAPAEITTVGGGDDAYNTEPF